MKEYLDATVPELAFGEYWDTCEYTDGVLNYNQDAHRQRTVNWCDRTGGTSAAFDFTTKGGPLCHRTGSPVVPCACDCRHVAVHTQVAHQRFLAENDRACVNGGGEASAKRARGAVRCAGILQEAMGRGEYWRLIDSQGRPPGLLGMWPSRAVTFIENHDTGECPALKAQFLVRGCASLRPWRAVSAAWPPVHIWLSLSGFSPILMGRVAFPCAGASLYLLVLSSALLTAWLQECLFDFSCRFLEQRAMGDAMQARRSITGRSRRTTCMLATATSSRTRARPASSTTTSWPMASARASASSSLCARNSGCNADQR